MSSERNIEVQREIMEKYVRALCEKDNDEFTLKGGTALMLAHDLDRFSEDIDLDSPSRYASSSTLFARVKDECSRMGHGFRPSKDTESVKRCFVRYDEEKKPIKIEASFRRRDVPESAIENDCQFRVYNIDNLTMMKASAYQARDRIRDLYDLSYLCSKHYGELSPATLDAARIAFEYKGIEQFDYMVRTQEDDLINTDKMETYFLDSLEKLGLFNNELERNFDDENPHFDYEAMDRGRR